MPAFPLPAAPITRRGFVLGAGSTAVLLGTGAAPAHAGSPAHQPRHGMPDYPFKVGVASGDPLPNSVVLWTRLVPDLFAADGRGGMPRRKVPVQWEVAKDDRFRTVVKRGTVLATPELNHSVHPEVWGLEPDRHYYYRFRVGGEISPVGRTKTAPAYGARNRSVSFAYASCAFWTAGYFTAYRHLADDDLDVVLHLGDYVYEHGIRADGGRAGTTDPAVRDVRIPEQFLPETTTLSRYRLQYNLYKSDPDLMAAHQAHPWVVTFDDHEVENNWAGLIPEASSQTPGALFAPRLSDGLQAYYENLPLRASAMPDGPGIQVFRRLSYGGLVDFHVLDTRQHRTDQATAATNAALRWDPTRTMLGARQEQWLADGLARSAATWQVVAQQVRFSEMDQQIGEGETYAVDNWDGYAHARGQLFDAVQERGVENLVVITGDQHNNWVSDLKPEPLDPGSPTLGVEFLVTSVTSDGDGYDTSATTRNRLAENPTGHFYQSRRGYQRAVATPTELRVDVRSLPAVTVPDQPVATRWSGYVEAGRPGLAHAQDGTIV
ncbi:alkaline phosphatase D family protein [Isoptericola sp. NPDC056618]|uniref:alkaline phosphatase D family protein n=1 Tax=Isoptericola sp. NPDC056618 TaxID=3345878 RepID=UPI0036CBCA27